jgi:hypothetical protein
LITTNLDNDDGLASDFVARIQEARVTERTAIYLVHGLIRSEAELYLRTDRSNAFCSVREDWQDARTCWSNWHNLLGESMNTMHLEGTPAWLQVIHESNVSNRVRGRRIAPGAYRPLFGELLDGAEDLEARNLVRDFALERPVRFVRDSGRALAKQGAMRVLGKDGFERLRSNWALRYGTESKKK